MPKLIAVDPIQHDGRDYAPGDTLDVADKTQAEALLDVGAARDPKAKPAAEPAPQE
jgi:hypothetical protein